MQVRYLAYDGDFSRKDCTSDAEHKVDIDGTYIDMNYVEEYAHQLYEYLTRPDERSSSGICWKSEKPKFWDSDAAIS